MPLMSRNDHVGRQKGLMGSFAATRKRAGGMSGHVLAMAMTCRGMPEAEVARLI
jgi:hypothetical protein